MPNERHSRATLSGPAGLKTCRWCGGPLVFEPNFPVLRLVPGEPHAALDDHIPPTLRTLPAWVCGTPFCKYREKA
jgi:hypothetical protein